VSLSAIPRTLRQVVLNRDKGRCQYYGLVQFGQGAVFHVNHVIPRAKGGAPAVENLVLQCPCCSLHKSDKLVAPDPQTHDVVALFHPVQQSWAAHFALESDGTCVGLTPVGRATVSALRMNDPIPRTARALQMKHGLL
jgi:hypothetical protein